MIDDPVKVIEMLDGTWEVRTPELETEVLDSRQEAEELADEIRVDRGDAFYVVWRRPERRSGGHIVWKEETNE